MRVAFRTDASVQIGTGHVMRCLTLADELTRQGHECWFVCREHDGHLGDLIASKGYDLTLLPSPGNNEPDANDRNSENYALWLGVPQQDDARQTLGPLKAWKPDWLVVDHYALDAQWERSLANAAGKIMVIDDLANRPHECALLLDQNLGRAGSDYDGLVPVGCQRLIGPRYALLRPEFAKLREQSLKRRRNPELRRILVSLGGVDRTNATGRVLEALSESALPRSTELDILMGAAAPYLDDVRQQAARLPFQATVSVNVKDMAQRMCLADLSIGAAGSTSWERCCLGLPSIIVEIADNQAGIVAAVVRAGAGIAPSGLHTSCFVHSFGKAVTKAIELSRLKIMSNSASEICDGDGASRLLQALICKGISVRQALSDDAENVWRWRNDGVSTEFYLSQKKTKFIDHLVWFESALASPERDLLIVEIGRASAAHVRFDRCLENKGAAEVSIYLNPDFRGRGLGAPILIAACNFAFAKGLSLILAKVHIENTASLKIFTRAGFKQLSINGSFKALEMAKSTFPE